MAIEKRGEDISKGRELAQLVENLPVIHRLVVQIFCNTHLLNVIDYFTGILSLIQINAKLNK